MKGAFVYIMGNRHNTVFYVSVTSDIISSVNQHKERHQPQCLTALYNINKLLFYKYFDNIEIAMEQETYIKGEDIEFKNDLIRRKNLNFEDLFPTIENW